MAEAITIARPYAKAVFEIAQEKSELSAWSNLLSIFATCVEDDEMSVMINSPTVTEQQLISILTDVAGDAMTADATNFLATLADNKRLELLSYIAAAYEALREESEKVITAEVVTAKALTEEQKAKISTALSKRLDRDVTLNILIDESLLGGAIIRAGDLVMDGSATGKLNKLATVLN